MPLPEGGRFAGARRSIALHPVGGAPISLSNGRRADAADALYSRNGRAMSTTIDEMLAFLELCDPESEAAALALLEHEFPEAPELERQEAARTYVLEHRPSIG